MTLGDKLPACGPLFFKCIGDYKLSDEVKTSSRNTIFSVEMKAACHAVAAQIVSLREQYIDWSKLAKEAFWLYMDRGTRNGSSGTYGDVLYRTMYVQDADL